MTMISAVVLMKNKEKNIERCLKSLEFCEEIIVVEDGEIRNPKLEIRNKSQIQIFQRKLNGDFAGQRNFGMEKASGEWILFVDSDEEVTTELREEIQALIQRNIQCFRIKRRDFFWGREMKYGETREIRERGLIRLVRKNSGKWEGRVHEIYNVKCQMSPLRQGFVGQAKVKCLENYLNHYPHQTIGEFIQSVNLYSSIRAEELKRQGKKTNIFEIILFPFGKFIYTYFLKLGFLDGAAGFVYSFMMSFHSFLARIKLYQKNI